MSSKLRLVAYRPATDDTTAETAYNLDLQEHPSVSLNFQFSDIKEPETRKASYSQTFKLPFTDNNNEFFQTWFNVNLTTLVFNARTKFDAVLYVGTLPQFEGFIQLKSVYQKAQMYEVSLVSNTASLFSVIGEKKLRDVFLNDDGNYSDELNHTYDESNLALSWNGASSSFVNNPGGVSLRDADAGVQKVMYPITPTVKNFYFDNSQLVYLNLTAAQIIAIAGEDNSSVDDAAQFIVPIEQFRPAIQLKTLFKLILARAGFSYTSKFIDGAYFGKLFTTTANFLTEPSIPTVGASAIPEGEMIAGNDGTWGNYYYAADNDPVCGTDTPTPTLFPANTDVSDTSNIWNTDDYYFTRTLPTMQELTIKTKTARRNIEPCTGTDHYVTIIVRGYNTTANADTDEVFFTGTYELVNINNFTSYSAYQSYEYNINDFVISLVNVPVGDTARIYMTPMPFKKSNDSLLAFFKLGVDASFTTENLETKIHMSWTAYNSGVFDNVVDVPACIDYSITQKAFLKDIIQRFNLVILADPDDASNIIIEPYNDYLAASTIKHWTDKLDTSKEIIVKDTTSLQKKIINLSDLEDTDLMNKSIKEEEPTLNVYGKYYNDNTNNDFATGELKNNSIYSPFINQKVFQNQDEQVPTELANMAVQYEFSYKSVEGGIENVLEATKPKLFYYNGSATTVKGFSDNTITYHLHHQPTSGATIDTYTFTTYPVCTPFDITPVDDAYTLTSANKSLYWNFAPPQAGELSIFNYNTSDDSWRDNTLFYFYWETYLNGIYSVDARIMEAYIMLDAVDIFNFKFNDEIFIKDTYWRILNIHNYQVGGTVSTKVTLLKIVDSLDLADGCNYIPVGEWEGAFYTWCLASNAGCTPDESAPNYLGLHAPKACCLAAGGDPINGYYDGLYLCVSNTGSSPVRLLTQSRPLSLTNSGQLKTLLSGKLGSTDRPLIRGVDTGKFSQAILPYFGDDIVIKYNTARKGTPQLQGEAHKIVLSGYTEADTRGYAYAEGNNYGKKIYIPINANIIIRVNGIATVIGGTSTTYVVGTTEAFAYYTAFKNIEGVITQLSTAGGQSEFSIREGANPTTCTLYIDTSSSGELQFGLDDSQTDTKRIWALTVDLAVQKIQNLTLPFGENWALYQSGRNIEFQNYNLLVWN